MSDVLGAFCVPNVPNLSLPIMHGFAFGLVVFGHVILVEGFVHDRELTTSDSIESHESRHITNEIIKHIHSCQGDNITLSCLRKSTPNNEVIKWWINRKLSPSKSPTHAMNNLQHRDRGNYTCAVENGAARHVITFMLHVHKNISGAHAGKALTFTQETNTAGITSPRHFAKQTPSVISGSVNQWDLSASIKAIVIIVALGASLTIVFLIGLLVMGTIRIWKREDVVLGDPYYKSEEWQ
ncbi:unnamed protein product [Owenia fusiformis]|uniref:Uncharacterized protein n=1 Tax=Owenia fusiformis TaxID=6347 RepID=A0A8J1TYH0_OWEFU|nr:unnamed protein product [Owenia fusiformis]